MKKVLLFIIFISLFSFGSISNACSPIDGANYPTVESLLKTSDIAIGLYQPESNGPVVLAKRIFGNSFSKEKMTFKTNKTSCSTRTTDFKDDEYIVAVFPSEDLVFESLDLDDQFSLSYKNKQEAEDKYREYIEIWNNRIDGDSYISYKPTYYTLKPGLKNNDDVKKLQIALKKILKKGDDFKIDGSYGPMTSSLVKEFQKKYGLEEDGLAGKLTQKKIKDVGLGEVEKETENNQTQNSSSEEDSSVKQDDMSSSDKNNDLIDEELKKVLLRAKNEIKNYASGTNTYTDAYSVVVKYNNEALQVSTKSDPLYYSSHNGTHFVYYAVLSNGKYICVDDGQSSGVVEMENTPNLETLDVSCS
jgi:peptidoglycan hydrolase-like protein with peptidoglycan-binding domain